MSSYCKRKKNKRIFGSMLNGSELKLAFDAVMEGSGGDISAFFSESGDISSLSQSDFKFVCELAHLSTRDLRTISNDLISQRFELNRKLESTLISADKSVLPFIDSIESVIRVDVNRIKTCISSFEISCGSVEALQSLREEKQTLRVLSEKSQHLQDFLDSAELMKECVSRSHFAEAWSLYEFSQPLLRRGSASEVTALSHLASELEGAKGLLVNAIEEALSTKSLRVQDTNSLLLIYRMIFPKVDLKEKFIEWRSSFYESRKAEIQKSNNPSRIIKDLLEHARVHLSEIINQFRAIFSQPITGQSHILSRYIVTEIDELFTTVESQLQLIPSESVFQSLAEIYSIATYMKLFDCNSRLNKLSHKIVSTNITKTTQAALKTFNIELSSYNWKPFLSLIPEGETDDSKLIHLTRNRPVAVLYNDVANLLNDVKSFPLVSVRNQVFSELDNLIRACLDMLCAYPSAPSTELAVAIKNMCHVLVPAIESYLSTVFHGNVKLEHTRDHFRFPQETIVVSE
jgi:hypothetical protein